MGAGLHLLNARLLFLALRVMTRATGPSLLVAALFGVLAALVTARLLNRYRLSNYFFYPPLVFLALMVIYTLLIGAFIIGI